MNKKICGVFLLFPLLLHAEIIKIPKSSVKERAPKVNFIKGMNIYRSKIVKDLLPRLRRKAILGEPETLRVLAIRVEFQKDDDPLTTGNGLMDIKGYGHPSDGLYYDPPHTKTYFEMQLLGLRNYILVNSKKKLFIEYDVYPEGEFDVYKLPHQMSFYGDPSNYERGLVYLMRDALWEADKDPSIDFSKYDAILIFRAGSALQVSWMLERKHDIPAGTVTEDALLYYLGRNYIEVDDGVKIKYASILPESPRVDRIMVGLPGILFHEFLHLLGAYDLYDVTGYSSGIGAWGLMGGGGWLGTPPGQIPAMVSAYTRYLLGWETPVIIKEGKVSLYCIAVDTSELEKIGDSLHPTLIKIPIRDGEYFLIENRQVNTLHNIKNIEDDTVEVEVEYGVPVYTHGGEYDAFLPGSGILIWHIDEEVIEEYGPYNAINIFPEHKGVDLEEADGIKDFDGWKEFSTYEIEGSPFDPFFVGNNTKFAENTNPNSDGYYGKTGIEITIKDTALKVMQLEIIRKRELQGFPKKVGNYKFTGITAGDLNGDGKEEIIASTYNGRVYVWELDGRVYLKEPLISVSPDSISLPPSLADINNDGKEELVISTISGKVYIYHAHSLPISVDTFLLKDRIYGSIMVFKNKLFVTSEKGHLYILTYKNGSWEKEPKVVDLNCRFYAGPFLFDSKSGTIGVLGEGGRLFLISEEGKIRNGFPLQLGSGNAPVKISPLSGDFDGDGEKEVIALIPEAGEYRLYLVSGEGEIKQKGRISVKGRVTHLAAANIDKDGLPEIIFAAGNKVYAMNFNGSFCERFPVEFASTYTVREVTELGIGPVIIEYSVPFNFYSSPVVCDADGNGDFEVCIGSPDKGIYIIQPTKGKIDTLMARHGFSSPLLVKDLNNDNLLELGAVSDRGEVYIWNLEGKTMGWSELMGNPQRTGSLEEKFEKIVPEKLIEKIYVYPNPVQNDKAKLRFEIGNAEAIKIDIMDISGELLYSIEPNFTRNEANDFPLDRYIRGLVPGMYILRFEAVEKGKREVKFYKFGVVR